ncbi:MAG: PIG-L family deacetylase [Chloroflexi bacterium]|nr:PIG-L family deacetylase [Chloroflexota bacterium]
MFLFGKRVVFLGAHPDDLKDVKDEHYKSMAVLGVPKENILLGPFTTRVFPDSRQEILEYFLKLRGDFNPDLIFTHSRQDVHQDHNTMTDEALRAFRGITVLGFDVVRSSHGFFPHFLAEVTEEDVNAKIEALSRYETYRDKYYFNGELTRSIMVRHGALAECPFAEGFDILRIVGQFEFRK